MPLYTLLSSILTANKRLINKASIARMFSNTPWIKSGAFEPRLTALESPVSFINIHYTTADSAHEEEKTLDDSTPLLFAPHPPSPLSTRADPLAGLRVKPKVNSGSTPAPWAKHDGHVAPQRSDARRKNPKQDLRRARSLENLPSQLVRSRSRSHSSPLQRFPATIVNDPATHGSFDESSALLPLQGFFHRAWEEQLLDKKLAGLSLKPHATGQQGYRGAQYPHTPAWHLPNPSRSVPPQQHQRQKPQQQGYKNVQYTQAVPALHLQQNVIPQQQQQPQRPSFLRGQYAQAVPPFNSQQNAFPQQQQPYSSQVQQHVISQPQSTFYEQQRQQFLHSREFLSPQQQQQQPLQSPIQVQPGVQAVYNPATRAYSYITEPPQKYAGGDNGIPGVKKQSTTTPWRSQPASQPVIAIAQGKLPTWTDDRKAGSSTLDGHQERRGLRTQFSSSLFGRSASFGGVSRQGLSPSHDSASLVSLSQVTTDDAPEMLRHESLGPDTVSSTGSDQILKSSTPAGRMSSNNTARALTPQTAVPIFPQAREDLERLQADIEDLSDSSNDSTEAVGSDLGMIGLSLSEEECNDHTTNNVREETGVGSSESQGLRMNTGEEASSSGGSFAQKRPQLDDDNQEHARTEIGVSRKRTKLSSLRYICCFHNGPERKCSGTDGSISEVLKKLSDQHDTHVCDRCWVLKSKDESSGLFVHPNDGQSCIDRCLSPQCHKTSPSIGHRHEFDPKTCGTKTSRVRPGDSEAVYRFIFRLVHPGLMCPATVLTAEHSLHLDAMPRQSRRKLNKEELMARANDLEIRLEAGEQQNAFNAIRIERLEQNLADAHLATTRAEEKNAALEKQSRRIIAMLSDALRTGMFLDTPDHQSLLRRVKEDAPDALIHHLSQSLLTPSESDRSRNSSATPARVNMAGPDPFPQPPTYDGPTRVPPLPTMPREHTTDGYMSDTWVNDANMDLIWNPLVDEQGDSDKLTTSKIR